MELIEEEYIYRCHFFNENGTKCVVVGDIDSVYSLKKVLPAQSFISTQCLVVNAKNGKVLKVLYGS